MRLDILFEDDALIFVNKPAGIVVQPRMHHPDEPDLHAAVTRHTAPAYLMQRLDRGTTGVMFFSKRSDLNARLTRQFQRRQIRKRYLAVCDGYLAQRQTIDAPLARVGAITFGVRDGGRAAITHVNPLQATPGGSLLAITLETGRTHQIRVHLSAIGHPLAGDWLYGLRNAARPMLHAAEIAMVHPLTNEPLCVAAPLPDDFLEEAHSRGLVMAEEEATADEVTTTGEPDGDPTGQGDPPSRDAADAVVSVTEDHRCASPERSGS